MNKYEEINKLADEVAYKIWKAKHDEIDKLLLGQWDFSLSPDQVDTDTIKE